MPDGSPGTVIRAERFSGGSSLPAAAVNYRILYEVSAPDGSLVAASGTLAIPSGEPPHGGWPLISWAHGTTGNGPQCAPSRTDAPNIEQRMLDSFVRRGYAVAQTDYRGNGTPGIHPYMVAPSLARDVASMVVAARSVDPKIGIDWIAMGHSEGGAVALAAAALGQKLLPDLRLAGVVSYAPFAFPQDILTGEQFNDRPNVGFMVLALIAEGFSTIDPRIVPDRMFEPQAVQLLPQLETRCFTELAHDPAWNSVIPRAAFRFDAEDQFAALHEDLIANDAANLRITVPVLLVQGGDDGQIDAGSTMEVQRALRSRGATVSTLSYPAADHGTVLLQSIDDVAPWVAGRFQPSS
ncbi:MAG TPA: alpha/beta fold hydrolase [Candidatus Tumulicola sp.]|jgi:pimeloyl-ACP methyl ester carboxylesterase